MGPNDAATVKTSTPEWAAPIPVGWTEVALPNEVSTAGRLKDVIGRSIDTRFGSRWQSADSLRELSTFVSALAARLHAEGIHACISCDALTESLWIGSPMCGQCKANNPAIQQMLAAGIREEEQ
jgi:hypothetical protein